MVASCAFSLCAFSLCAFSLCAFSLSGFLPAVLSDLCALCASVAYRFWSSVVGGGRGVRAEAGARVVDGARARRIA